MLFSKGRNIALGQAISASTSSLGPGVKFAAHNQKYIVDGFVPYLMDSYQGTKSPAFYSVFPVEATPALTIDLEAPHSIHQINIHAMELSDSVPQTNRDDYGLPKQLRIEAANQADFSDATVLVDYRMQSIYDSGPIIVHHFPEQTYRYLKLTALKPDTTHHSEYTTIKILGFAEIEVLSANTNVALGKTVAINTEPFPGRNNFEALTDGRNFYGELIPFDQWMRQLARRHDLEVERPQILDELNQRYARQKTILRIMVYLVIILTAGIFIIYLIGRVRAMKQIAQVRKRFAADLHDELGANLHAIGLLSDLAYEAVDEKEKLQHIINEVRTVTERTSDAVRYCANSQEARDPLGSLREDMHRIAKRMMHDVDYQITVQGEDFLQGLKLRTRNDLFLFYKECLANISRHSGATQFKVQLNADTNAIQLRIEDNGCGYDAQLGAEVPPSLKRRAQLMHGQIHLTRPATGGTQIHLTLKRRRFFFMPL
jgi:signal transduction histidine kinase